jgi:hypothetical protein
LILRGRFEDADRYLLAARDRLKDQEGISRANPKLKQNAEEWIDRAARAYANRSKDELQDLWKDSPLIPLCIDALTPPMTAELYYAIALNNHEQAERLQARAQGPEPRPSAAQIQDAWQAAADGWWAYLKFHGQHPGSSAGHRLAARAQEALGKPEAARSIFENLGQGITENKAAPLSELEKLACLVRARQVK